MINNRLIPVILMILFLSCTPKSPFNGQEKIVNSFPKTIEMEGQKVNLEILGMVDLEVVDTFLVAYTPFHVGHYYQVYSTNDYKHLGNFAPEGRGPGEFYAIVYGNCDEIDSDGSKMWYSNSLQQYRWNITASVREQMTIIDSTIQLKGPLLEGVWYPGKDGAMFGFEFITDNKYTIYREGKELAWHNIYPVKIGKKQISVANLMPCIKPDKTKIALIGWNLNCMCIRNTYSSDFCALSIYGRLISLYQIAEKERGERNLFYCHWDVTNSHIYALYLNQPEKNRDYHSGNIEIHIFDWEANPVMNIIIPENIIFFTVDEKHKCIYGMTSDEKIYKYDLAEHLIKM